MNRQPQPDAELVRYLALLAGREPAGGLLEIRYRHPAKHQRMHQHWHPTAHPARAAREILKLAEHTDVYVGAAPRRHRHGGRSAIHRAWVLWADLDEPAEVAGAAWGLDTFGARCSASPPVERDTANLRAVTEVLADGFMRQPRAGVVACLEVGCSVASQEAAASSRDVTRGLLRP